MTTKVVSDEQLGKLARRQNDLFRRVKDGTLPFDRVLDDLQRLIEGRTWQQQGWPIWKTITIGGRSWKDLSAELEAMGIKIADSYRKAMETCEMLKEPIEVDLVLLRERDFLDSVRLFRTPKGLVKCPLEVAAYLRLGIASGERWGEIHVDCPGMDVHIEDWNNERMLGYDGEDDRAKIILSTSYIFVRPRNPAEVVTEEPTDSPKNADGSYKVWKTITYGGKTWAELLAEMEAKGIKVGRSLRNMMAMYPMSKKPKTVDLVRLCGEDMMKFYPIPGTPGVQAKTGELNVCTPEMALYLRLAYTDQCHGEHCTAFSDIVRVQVDHHDSGLWVSFETEADDDEICRCRPIELGPWFIYVLPRKPAGQTEK